MYFDKLHSLTIDAGTKEMGLYAFSQRMTADEYRHPHDVVPFAMAFVKEKYAKVGTIVAINGNGNGHGNGHGRGNGNGNGSATYDIRWEEGGGGTFRGMDECWIARV